MNLFQNVEVVARLVGLGEMFAPLVLQEEAEK